MSTIAKNMSRLELSEAVSAAERRREQAARALDLAQRNYIERTANYLFRSDQSRELALRDELPVLESAEEDVRREVDAIDRDLRGVLAQAADASVVLPAAVTAQAATMAPLIELEVKTAPVEDLAARVRETMAAGDVARMYLFLTTMPTRIFQERAQAKDAGRAAATVEGKTGWPAGADEMLAGANDLDSLIGQLRTRLRDRWFTDLHARTISLLKNTVKLRVTAEQRAKEAAGAGTTVDGRPKTTWPKRG